MSCWLILQNKENSCRKHDKNCPWSWTKSNFCFSQLVKWSISVFVATTWLDSQETLHGWCVLSQCVFSLGNILYMLMCVINWLKSHSPGIISLPASLSAYPSIHLPDCPSIHPSITLQCVKVACLNRWKMLCGALLLFYNNTFTNIPRYVHT